MREVLRSLTMPFRALFYLRSISKSLDKIATLYEMELDFQGIRRPDPNAKDPQVEVLYGPKVTEAEWPR